MTQFRPGSDGAAEQKSMWIFCGFFTLANIIIFGILYFHWFNTDQYWYRKAAGAGWNAVGIILFIVSTASLWLGVIYQWKWWQWGILWLGALLLAWQCSCGWNFSDIALPGHQVIPNQI